jgi:hypothetical protein
MPSNRVRVNALYYFHPNLLDLTDGRNGLKSGDVLRVINLPGCPKAGTMGHCHVADPVTGIFIGLVHVNSLHTKAEYLTYLRSETAERRRHE